MATPTNSRLSVVAPWGIKLTPTQFSSSTNPKQITTSRSSSKRIRDETGLSLSHVIGTTANSPNSVTTLPVQRLLAFTAGAAVVICSFDEKLRFTQRFYRARPTAVPLNPTPATYGPSTPTGGSTFSRRAAASESAIAATTFSPLIGDYAESPVSKSRATRERVKAATCVSFSPDGKYLAVGETGHKPRVLIFSTSKESSPDCPLTCLPDHTVGVQCVAFSPNSQYLASLGTDRDGFLLIWSINRHNGGATLHASNKCTAQINQIAWMGSSLVTVGKRHVKVWRLDDSVASTPVTTPLKISTGCHPSQMPSHLINLKHKTLQGRNCLLGSLQECRFTAIVTISTKSAIVCSDGGDICWLDDTEGAQRFRQLTKVSFSITAASLGANGVVLVAGRGMMKCFDVENLLSMTMSQNPPITLSSENLTENAVVALSQIGDFLVSIDEKRAISLIETPAVGECSEPTVVLRLPAHGGPVLGVRRLAKNDVLSASFFTWSADGSILFWDASGVCKRTFQVPLEQPDYADPSDVNELRVVRTLTSAGLLITGDKFGFLQFIEEKSGDCIFSLRAHLSEVTDIAVLQSRSLIVSCGRDRTAQVFQRIAKTGSWELQQTLDEHVGAVTGLTFTNDGKQLLSCSSDRTIVVRDALKRQENGQVFTIFEIKRTLQTKGTPVAMALLTDRDDALFVSTMDRNVQKWNLASGQKLGEFKAGDGDGGDAVILSSLIHLASVNGSNILAGVSSTDKSLRLYNENGSILGRDWGHTEGITDLTIISLKPRVSSDDTVQKSLVTVAFDGTVFIWTFGARHPIKHDLSSSMELMGLTPVKDSLSSKPPLRRVLSQSEMARFRQSSPEQEETTPTNASKRTQPMQPMIRKTSRFSLAQRPVLEPAPSSYDGSNRRRTKASRSPSPPSPKRSSPQHASMRRKSYMDVGARSASATGSTRASRASVIPHATTPHDLAHNTDSICRALRSYRRKLAATSEPIPPEKLQELERELSAAVRAVGEKAIKAKDAFGESQIIKILNQFSEIMLEKFDQKINSASNSEKQLSESSAGAGVSSASSAEDESTIKIVPETEEKPRDTEVRSRKSRSSLTHSKSPKS